MPDKKAAMERIRESLERLYGENAALSFARISNLIGQFKSKSARILPPDKRIGWDERDVVLITYGDQVQQKDQPHLQTLRRFLVSHGLDKFFRNVHVLSFYPFSSDDGFSVIDYRQVDPELGNWQDIRELGESFELMFDLVLNHISRRSQWFQEFLAGHKPYDRFFIEQDPATDLSAVTRPRNSPLLTAFETSLGTKYVWTTFSDDQVDLNFANPDVLIEMLDVFLYYIQQGARIIRLDAIAYLWKQVGTNCIHLPETHEVVKLLRDVVDVVAPHVLLLTETNVPHAENARYFGDDDEAHLVYQFSLPPLLLDAILSGDAGPLTKWLSALTPTKRGTCFVNFTASHDGIGVRPLEGLVNPERINKMVNAVKARGGRVSTRQKPDGTETPYELNISYFSAMSGANGEFSELHIRRFLTAQGLMLSLRGIPAIYFHSLFGTPNDKHAAELSKYPRRINRRKFQLEEFESSLNEIKSAPAAVFTGFRHLLSVRVKQPAFHPDASQEVWRMDNAALIVFVRTSTDQTQKIVVVANVSAEKQWLDVSEASKLKLDRDLLSGRASEFARRVLVAPYELLWLSAT